MTTFYEIPLQSTPQSFPISLGGTTYNLTVTWNVQSQNWILDIADASSNPLAQGNPLLPGYNILGQLAYLGIPGQLFVQSDYSPDAPPTFTDLGQQGGAHLVYATNP
jgi:hypothetical protein